MIRPGITEAFRLALRRRHRVDRDVLDELEHHLAERVEYLVARGLPPGEARAEALRRFARDDSLERVHRRLTATARYREDRMHVRERLDAVASDARFALRQLRRAPGFAAAVVATA